MPNKSITLRIDTSLFEYLEKRAEREHRTLSNMIISILMDAKEQELSPIPRWISPEWGLPKLGETVAVYTHSSLKGDVVSLDKMIISNAEDIPYWELNSGRVKAWMRLPYPPHWSE